MLCDVLRQLFEIGLTLSYSYSERSRSASLPTSFLLFCFVFFAEICHRRRYYDVAPSPLSLMTLHPRRRIL